MLVETPSRFAAAVQPRNDLALHVHHLALGVDAEARPGVVHVRGRPGRIQRWRLDVVRGLSLAEIPVDAGLHKGIGARHGRLQGGPRPAVVYFTTVLVVAALMTVPAVPAPILGALVALGSLGGLCDMGRTGAHTQWRQ